MITRKIDLKKSAGISLCYEKSQLVSKDFSFKKIVCYKINDIREELLNQELYCPESFYKKYIGADHNEILHSKNLNLNYYVIDGGIAGIEYIKTHVYTTGDYSRALEVLAGRGILILHVKNKIFSIAIKVGDKVLLPPNTNFIIVNTKYSPLIVEEMYNKYLKNSMVNGGRKSVPYFVINKNSKPAIVKNPNYGYTEDIEKIKIDSILDKYGISPKTPLIKQVMRKYEKFTWLVEPNCPMEICQ